MTDRQLASPGSSFDQLRSNDGYSQSQPPSSGDPYSEGGSGIPPPPQSYDIVGAVQYGVYERVVELVEGGYNVNQPDRENVSLLHWAAINNRAEIVKYLMSKGASIDKFGGDLHSTPLHWATRQGHLSMVIQLMSLGADPSLIDGEGCSCIHLAAQFGHTALVAYLIARGQDVDMKDRNGMTALMWSCLRVVSIDPTHLLLLFGASVNARDHVNGNTPLHWACSSGNHAVVRQLLDAGSDIICSNGKDETPLELAGKSRNIWVVEKLRTELVARGLDKSAKIWTRAIHDPKVKLYTACVIPFLTLFLIGFILDVTMSWWWKALCALPIFIVLRLCAEFICDDPMKSSFPLWWYLATKFWMFFTWFFYFWPYQETIVLSIIVVTLLNILAFIYVSVPTQTNSDVSTPGVLLLFLINSTLLFYYFIKAWRADPGVIRATREERIQTILDLSERHTLDPAQFCHTCIVRRPLRSKHCTYCDRCVGKFDHHCPWVDNCIGAYNLKYFVGYLFFLLGMISWCLYGSYLFWLETCSSRGVGVEGESFLGQLWRVLSCNAWVSWIALNALAHFTWVSILLACQLYQVMWLAATTNERMNFARYQHFHTSKPGVYRSPFHRGYIQNLVDLCGWSLPGFHAHRYNWVTTYSDNNSTMDRGKSSSKDFLLV